MANNETTVSNSYLSSNPDFNVADDKVGTKRYQQVKLIDSTVGSTDPVGTAANPLHVQGTSVGGDVNLAEVGGVAVALGETIKAESIPVTLAGDGSMMYRVIESSKIVDVGTTTSIVVASAGTTARAGDYIQFTAFAAAGLLNYWFKIASVSSPNITLVDPLPSLPVAGVDVFRILRQAPMVTSAGGGLDINVTNITLATTDAATAAINAAVSPAFVPRGQDAIGASSVCLIAGTNSNSFNGDAATIPAVTDIAPGSTEPGLVTRNIPSGTQTISGTVSANCRDGAGNSLVSTTTAPDLTDRGLITKSVIHASDGGGISTTPLQAANDTPSLFDTGLITRSITYTTDGFAIAPLSADASGRPNTNSRTLDGSGNSIASATGTPTTAQRGLLVRNINYNYDSGALAHFRAEGNSLYGTTYTTEKSATGISKSFNTGNSDTGTTRVVLAANQPTVRDSSGNAVASATTTPSASDRGLTTRSFSYTHDADGAKITSGSSAVVYNGQGLAVRKPADVYIASSQEGPLVAPQGYYFYTSRTTAAGSTTTVINTTTDPSTQVRRGDLLRVTSGTHAEGIYQQSIVSSVTSSTITLQFPLAVAPPTTRTVSIYKPLSNACDASGYLFTKAYPATSFPTYPVYANKFFCDKGELAFGSISGAYATIATTVSQIAVIKVVNGTNVPLMFSFDGGTTDWDMVPAGQSATLAAIQNGGYVNSSTDIQVKDIGSAASSGSAYYFGYYF